MWNYQNALAGQRSPEFGQRWLGSSNLKVPITLSSMVPAVSSNSRQWRRNRARQPWIPTIDRRNTVTLGAYGWSKMEEGVVGNKIQPVVSSKTVENPGGVKWNSNGFKLRSSAFRLVFGQGNDGQLLRFRLVPSSAETLSRACFYPVSSLCFYL